MTQLVFYILLFPSLVFASLAKDNSFENNLREACYSQILLSAKNSLKLFDKVKKAQESYRNTEFGRLGLKPLAKIVPANLYSEKFNQIWIEMVDDVSIAQGNMSPDKSIEYTLKLGKEFEKSNKKFMRECSAIYTNIFTICAASMGAGLTEEQKNCVQAEVPRLKKMLDPIVKNLLDRDQRFDKLDKELDVTIKKARNEKDVKKAQRIMQSMAETECHPDIIKAKYIYYIIKHHNHAFKKNFNEMLKSENERLEVMQVFNDKFALIREAGRKYDLTYFKEMLRLKFPLMNKADKKLLISQMKNKYAIDLIH